MPNYSEVEEELLAQQQEEEERAQALEEQRQIDRLQAQQESPSNQLAQAGTNLAKKLIKDAAEEEAVAAATAAGSAIVASAPIWGPIVGILAAVLLILGLGVFVIISMASACNADGVTGFAARLGSWGAGVLGISTDVCKDLSFQGGQSGGAGASGAFDKLTIVITSAYRPGSIVAGTNTLSAHSRGEAVDIALRNPTVPIRGSDPRIAQLVQIAKSAGFVPAAGDTLDEYTNPTEGASGGHVHIEFNTKPDGTTYCDGTKVKNPPTDLVAIPSWIPVEGAQDARLRPCMLDKVENIFISAGVFAP